VGTPLQKEEAANEVAAEDEEGVDAEEAAASPGKAGVVGENGAHGQSADTVERRLVREAALAVVGRFALMRG
jgi:hypothetical protein